MKQLFRHSLILWTLERIRSFYSCVCRNTQRCPVCDEPPGKVPAGFLQCYLLHSCDPNDKMSGFFCMAIIQQLPSYSCFEFQNFIHNSLSDGFFLRIFDAVMTLCIVKLFYFFHLCKAALPQYNPIWDNLFRLR